MESGFRVETALRKKQWGSDGKEIQEVFKALRSIYIYIYFFSIFSLLSFCVVSIDVS